MSEEGIRPSMPPELENLPQPQWPRWKIVMAYAIFAIVAAVSIGVVDWKVHLGK